MNPAIYAAVSHALRNGWTPAAIVATLRGATRGDNGLVLPWCHRCDQPILDGTELSLPTQDDGIYEIWCLRCLTGPNL